MGAPFEVEQIRVLKIGNAGGTAQHGLPISVVQSSAHVKVGLINFNSPRRDPWMAGRESLQTLLRRRRVSGHGLQKRGRPQFVIVQLLLLNKRESRGTLPQQYRQDRKRS